MDSSLSSFCPDATSSNLNLEGAWSPQQGASGLGEKCPVLQATATNGSTLSFSFSGSQLSLDGLFASSSEDDYPLFLYAIDNGSTSTGFMPSEANGSVRTFYQSPVLANTAHTFDLGLVFTGDSSAFFLDSIVVAQAHTETQLVSNSTVNGAGDGGDSHSTSVPISAIAGGVAGGVILFVGALVSFYYMYWKRRHLKHDHLEGEEVLHEGEKWEITPLILSPAPPGTSSTPVLTRSPPPVATRTASLVSSRRDTGELRVANEPDSGDARTTAAYRKASEAKSERALLLQHRDSGIRFQQRQSEAGPSSDVAGPSSVPIEDLPPVYSES